MRRHLSSGDVSSGEWRRSVSSIENRNRPHQEPTVTRPLGGYTKRIIDIAIALVALVGFLPLVLMVALTITLVNGPPIFYRHPRVGHARRLFHCLKFRTMVANSDEVLHNHLRASADAAREWTETRKLKDDPRVTVVGTVLRKTSLDELPQLINVLCGDMSIVGPRPIVVDEIRMYGPEAEYYFQARPGLTGAWQVTGRNDSSYQRRVALDRAYVEHWSIITDITIMLKTIPAVLARRGSY